MQFHVFFCFPTFFLWASAANAHLSNRVVRGVRCLQTLVAWDSHSDMSRLDHSYIVSSVTDGQRDHLHLFLHHLNHFWLLERRNSKNKELTRNLSCHVINVTQWLNFHFITLIDLNYVSFIYNHMSLQMWLSSINSCFMKEGDGFIKKKEKVQFLKLKSTFGHEEKFLVSVYRINSIPNRLFYLGGQTVITCCWQEQTKKCVRGTWRCEATNLHLSLELLGARPVSCWQRMKKHLSPAPIKTYFLHPLEVFRLFNWSPREMSQSVYECVFCNSQVKLNFHNYLGTDFCKTISKHLFCLINVYSSTQT